MRLTGVGIGRGRAVGPVARMPPPIPEPPATRSAEAPEAELLRAREALATVAASLRRRAAAAPVGADILEAQALMAEDPALAERVARLTVEGRTAARAVYEAFDEYRSALLAAGPYIAQRVADVDDVRQRTVAACLGLPVPQPPNHGRPYVLVADDLAPADTASLDLSTVLALVTVDGGPTSHTAILARSRGLPAVVGCAGADMLADGATVLVDATTGRVIVDPTDADRATPSRPPVAVPGLAGPGRTSDGVHIALLANVGRPEEALEAAEAGAEGIGLFRTEFLFMGAASAPDESRQADAYGRVFAAFAGRRVVVRVLDAGADKPLAFLPGRDEPNPALGLRGLRTLRATPGVLDTQLRAIASAAAQHRADVWVMAPMVADADEAAWFVARVRRHGLATAGVMVEIPSAALLADSLLAAADFASIGTNDLAQYTLAADRQLGGLAALQDPWHPAVLRLVGMVGDAGRLAGKPVGVCGEAAADPLLACVLVGLGATSLSMAAAALPNVQEALAARTSGQCHAMAEAALRATTAAEARAAAEVRSTPHSLPPDGTGTNAPLPAPRTPSTSQSS